MSKLSIYDEAALARLTQHQIENEWDLARDLPWSHPINTQLPLVALDEHAIVFPGASSEQRLVISQAMGLIIAACIYEMEECLLRLKKECWIDVCKEFPVHPEFEALGERFFEEEAKHSEAFKKYFALYSDALGVDPALLSSLLPKIEKSKTEAILKLNLKTGGKAFWWIVASVEQQFLHLYGALKPFKGKVEPLYYELHEKHFEEEARHMPFPYLVLELLSTRDRSLIGYLHKKADLVASQFLQTLWTISSLSKMKKVKDLKGVHPFFDALSSVYPILEKQPPARILWQMISSVPYVSSLVNLKSQKKILRFADQMGSLHVPFPEFEQKKLVGY